jgi:tetratricopeptide (TPR) repeat protein
VLYRSSIVSTGPGSTAVVVVNGEKSVVPPQSSLVVDSLIGSRERIGRFGWLKSLTRAVKSAFNAITGKENAVVMGGRANNSGENDEIGWVMEDEDEQTFAEAMLLIEDGAYAEAIADLKLIVDPLPGAFLPGEIEFWVGYCQYQLENYAEADKAHKTALDEIQASPTDPEFYKYYHELLFQAGSARYLIGDFAGAVGPMELLAQTEDDRYAAYTYLILIDSLTEIGSKDRAREFLQYAQSHLSGSGYDEQFADLEQRLK